MSTSEQYFASARALDRRAEECDEVADRLLRNGRDLWMVANACVSRHKAQAWDSARATESRSRTAAVEARIDRQDELVGNLVTGLRRQAEDLREDAGWNWYYGYEAQRFEQLAEAGD